MNDSNPPAERRSGVAAATVGVIGCAACCAGPILGWLAAVGIGTAGGVALFGVGGLAIAAVAMTFVVRRRRDERRLRVAMSAG